MNCSEWRLKTHNLEFGEKDHEQSESQSTIEQESLISVKKELNRLYILGTLITWFASYPVKSSQILKNHSVMLFTYNANSL